MRYLLVALGLFASISGAFAQEYEIPKLRGSYVPDAAAPLYRPPWSEFYIGGHLGYGIAAIGFSQTTGGLFAHELRNATLENEQHPSTWTALGSMRTRHSSFGGFLGYNIAWESLMLDFERNHSHSDFASDAQTFPIGRLATAGDPG